VQFTQILYNQRRLPLPLEGWETYQPPVYYLINTLLSPQHVSHTFLVRTMSVFYGVCTLLLIIRLLVRFQVPPSVQMMVLSFIATTPAFLFMYTTYNNDSLATLLSVAILVTAYEWILQGQRWLIFLFGMLIAAGVYTKLTVVFPVAALCMVLGFLGLSHQVSWERIWPVFIAVSLGALLLSPWLVAHNYRHTGHLTPTPADALVESRIHLSKSAWQTVLTPPGWSHEEWKDPYAHLWEESYTKKNSYLAYLFNTSVFSEYRFEILPSVIPWTMLILHAILWIAAPLRARKSAIGRLSLGFIVLGAGCLTSLIFRAPYASHMDFRYIAWVWLPFAMLYATCLVTTSPAMPRFSIESLFRILMISGVVVQGMFWLALVLGGQWNIPF
jgi:4-amino-4-deoxy-L-arabinose transferase-like glycosyltransferase